MGMAPSSSQMKNFFHPLAMISYAVRESEGLRFSAVPLDSVGVFHPTERRLKTEEWMKN